jgi:hypothetical protein
VTKPNAKHTRTLVTRPPDARPAERFEVGDTGGSVSFAFGRKGFRSSVWNVAVSPKGDIYINERAVAAAWGCDLTALNLDAGAGRHPLA